MSFELRRRAIVEAVNRELVSSPLLLLTSPRGGGKSHLLERLYSNRPSETPAALLQLEPVSGSPEILQEELSRLAGAALGTFETSAHSFDAVLRALAGRRENSILYLDDVTEIRTLSYYPGVEEPPSKFLEAVAVAGKAILTSRFSYWMRSHFPEIPMRAIPPISSSDLEEAGMPEPELVASASGGIVVHAIRLGETLQAEASSVEEALVREMSPGGRIEAECRATLAELLHRARGYGACKTMLRELSRDEGLKLTEVARRVGRTAGATRDYLRWLEEVDLVFAREKRFYYVDRVLRLWMRIYGTGHPANEGDVRREVEGYLESLAPRPAADGESPSDEAFTLPPLPREDFVEID